MTALAGNFNLTAARFLTGGTAVLTLAGAGARDMRAFFVIHIFHGIPHSTPLLARPISCQNMLGGSLRSRDHCHFAHSAGVGMISVTLAQVIAVGALF